MGSSIWGETKGLAYAMRFCSWTHNDPAVPMGCVNSLQARLSPILNDYE